MLAPQGDISVSAGSIAIQAGTTHSQNHSETRSKQSGLTLALSSPVISAAQTVGDMAQAAGQTDDPRMQALAAATAGLAGKNAYDAVQANGGGLSLSHSLGRSQSQSRTESSATQVQASTLQAGGDLTLQARGQGRASTLTVQGSDLTAGGNATLGADGDIQLLAAANTSEQLSSNKSSGASLGISLGQQTGVTVSASRGKGQADGQDTTWRNARVSAGQTLTLQSGGDTTLKGATATGEQIIAQAGGDLSLESLQDTATYRSKQQNLGGSLTLGPSPGASLSYGKSKIDSDDFDWNQADQPVNDACQAFAPKLDAVARLARCNDNLVQPIFARSTAIGSLMRRKIEPVITPLLKDIAELRH